MNVNELVREAYKVGMNQVKEEAKMFATFLSHNKPANFMEIGSNRGGMFYVMCNSAIENGIKISLDLPCDRWGNKFNIEKRNIMMKSWDKNIYILEGNSSDPKFKPEIEEILNGEQLDVLFIDGDHSYKGVKNDFGLYSPFVKTGGYIGFHDINDTPFHRRQGCFVSKFWYELEGEKFEFNSFRRWGGIGLYRKD